MGGDDDDAAFCCDSIALSNETDVVVAAFVDDFVDVTCGGLVDDDEE